MYPRIIGVIVQLAQNSISNSNSEHIDVQHYVLKELVGRKEIPIVHELPPFQQWKLQWKIPWKTVKALMEDTEASMEKHIPEASTEPFA